MDEMKDILKLILSDLMNMKSDINDIKSDVGTLKSDVGTLKSDVGTLKSDVSTLKSDVSTLKSDMSDMKNRMDKMESRMDNMESDMKSMKDDIKVTQSELKVMKNYIEHSHEELSRKIEEGDEKNYREIRKLNGKLAVFQHESSNKIDILFDADTTKQELLESHEQEISEINSELFEHSTRIDILESKRKSKGA